MYMQHPPIFNGGCDIIKAEQLVKVIYELGKYGYFPDTVTDLTEKLTDLFTDVQPDKDGNKKLDKVIYYKQGIIKDAVGNYAIAPPFDTPKPETNDISDRIKLVSETMKYTYQFSTQHTMKQLAFAMSGKKPGVRNGVVGKSLFKIEQLVSKMEAVLAEDPDTDRRIVFRDPLLKIEKEITGPLETYNQNKLYPYSYRHIDGLGHNYSSSPIYAIVYAGGDIIEDVAEQLMTGALTTKRIQTIMGTINHENKTQTWFVPIGSLIGIHSYFCTNDYKDAVILCMQNHGIVLSQYATFKNSAGTEYHQNTFYTAENYAENLMTNKSRLIEPIYDAIQAYNAYDACDDEKVRNYFITAGYLVKDWKPDPQLWLRAAKVMPPWFNQDERYMFGGTSFELDNDIISEIISITENYANDRLDSLNSWLSGDKTQSMIRQLLG